MQNYSPTISKAFHPGQNLFLASLSRAEQHRLFHRLELIVLEPGVVLHEPFEPLDYVYFPVESVISILCETDGGEAAKFAVVGNEGVFGSTLLLGGHTKPRRAIAQRGGATYRLRKQVLKTELARYGELHDQFLLYVQATFIQTAQIAACNRHHTVEQQLCRWLLFFLDRSFNGRVNMTHERIAHMLGVRREGVTLAARRLHKQGVISYHRGEIEVLDRPRLEQLSCECYEVVKRETERLFRYDRRAAKTA